MIPSKCPTPGSCQYPEALARVLAHILPTPHETVPLLETRGRVLAEDLYADRDWPPFNRAAMDGFAVRSSDVSSGRRFTLLGRAEPGLPSELHGVPGCCIQITTGCCLPAGTDAVIAAEHACVTDRVVFDVPSVIPGANVHRQASDARVGDVLVSGGSVIFDPVIGVAAALGLSRLRVFARPRIVILTTGNEIVPPSVTPSAYRIRNSNGPMLATLMKRLGAALLASNHLADDIQQVENAIDTAMQTADLVLTIGGAAGSDRDHIPRVLDRRSDRWILRGVRAQPGRHMSVACCENNDHLTHFVLLPGNPVAAMICACLFVWPMIRRMTGDLRPLSWTPSRLITPLRSHPVNDLFRPVKCREPACPQPLPYSGSGDLCHLAQSDGFLWIPPEPRSSMVHEAHWLRWPDA